MVQKCIIRFPFLPLNWGRLVGGDGREEGGIKKKNTAHKDCLHGNRSSYRVSVIAYSLAVLHHSLFVGNAIGEGGDKNVK